MDKVHVILLNSKDVVVDRRSFDEGSESYRDWTNELVENGWKLKTITSVNQSSDEYGMFPVGHYSEERFYKD